MVFSRIDIRSMVHLECDGRTVSIPAHVQGIVVLNVGSYMGGVDVWNQRQRRDGRDGFRSRQEMDDGVLEIVGIGGPWHLGRLQFRAAGATRLAQCRRVRISLRGAAGEAVPMHVDGEPFRWRGGGTVDIERRGARRVLRRKG